MSTKYKYIILDFGKVLAGPATGNWFITPKFLELVDINEIDQQELNKAIEKYNYHISGIMITEQDEYEGFYKFYDAIFKEINYSKYSEKLVHEIAYDFAYQDDKFSFYENIKEELKELSKEYPLILLTDNWPSVERILNNQDLTKYFKKIYISSCYGVQKRDKVFFDYVINDFDINKNEALFIDDNELNLEVAKEKGLDILLMDREGEFTESKYLIIKDLLEIKDKA